MTTIAAMHTYRLTTHWETAITGWVAWLRLSGMAASSIGLRRSHVRSIARRTGVPTPRDLTVAAVIDLFSLHDWSREHRKAMRVSLHSFADWAVTNNLMDVNPADHLPRVKHVTANARPVSEGTWHALLEAAAPRERLMARLAGECGMRRAEVAKCHRRDLIHETSGWSLIVHGKGDRQRVVPVTDDLAAAILGHTPAGYLFPGQQNGHLSIRYVGELLSQLMGADGTMHQLRHRFASRAYQETRDLRAVQRVLGHGSIATTERYVASTEEDARRIVEAVAKAS